MMPIDNVDESRIVEVDIAFKNISDVFNETKLRVEFITNPQLEILVELDDQLIQPEPNT